MHQIVVPKNSSGVLLVRLRNPRTGLQVTDAAVTCTLKRSATTIFSGRAMTYQAAGKAHPADPESGYYEAAYTAAELNTVATHTVEVTATKGATTFNDSYTVEVE
jgi:hypothetical protein